MLHVAGRRDHPELAARELPAGYDLREYLDLERVRATRSRPPTWSSRAPAARCSRSPRSGLPAILVPYPHASADHQSANARWMADAGAAVVIADGELNAARLAAEVAELLADRERLAAMAARARAACAPAARLPREGRWRRTSC